MVEVPKTVQSDLPACIFVVPADFNLSAAAGTLGENGVAAAFSKGPEGLLDPGTMNGGENRSRHRPTLRCER